MAEMGTGNMTPSLIRANETATDIRLAPLPNGTVTLKVSVLSSSNSRAISSGPIMPEGFLTYTTLIPSSAAT